MPSTSHSFVFFLACWFAIHPSCVHFVVSAQNVAMTSNGLTVATDGSGRLMTRRRRLGEDVDDDSEDSITFLDPPDDLSAFTDVSIDNENESLVFALSVLPPRICSYTLLDDDSDVDNNSASSPLTLANCVGSTFAVNPFCGISALGGTLVVSGGTGGVSVFDYNAQTGMLQSVPRVENDDASLQVIGNPDVVMISSSQAALSSDIGGSPRFGSTIVNVEEESAVTPLRQFRIPNSSGFQNALGPSNFPLVNAIYRTTSNNDGDGDDDTSTKYYMYTANGGMQVQDPDQDNGGIIEIPPPPLEDGNFQAVTVAVNQEQAIVVFGGLLASDTGNDDGLQQQSMIYTLDIINLSTLVPRGVMTVNGRITSVASNGNAISYVTRGGTTIEQFALSSMMPSSSSVPTITATSMTSPNGLPSSSSSSTLEPSPTAMSPSDTSSAHPIIRLRGPNTLLLLTLLFGVVVGTTTAFLL